MTDTKQEARRKAVEFWEEKGRVLCEKDGYFLVTDPKYGQKSFPFREPKAPPAGTIVEGYDDKDGSWCVAYSLGALNLDGKLCCSKNDNGVISHRFSQWRLPEPHPETVEWTEEAPTEEGWYWFRPIHYEGEVWPVFWDGKIGLINLAHTMNARGWGFWKSKARRSVHQVTPPKK